MVKNLFKRFFASARDKFLQQQENSDEPWAMFEVVDFEQSGRIKVEFNWNAAFIERINALGFHAETEEDSVQLFFYASQMKPTELSVGDDPVQADATPRLSSPANIMRT
jgi:hypothetical protein